MVSLPSAVSKGANIKVSLMSWRSSTENSVPVVLLSLAKCVGMSVFEWFLNETMTHSVHDVCVRVPCGGVVM